MRRALIGSLILAAAFGGGAASAETPLSSADLMAKFDASLNASEMGSWMKVMASEPNHVGSAHDKANAEMVLAQFKSWGWDAHIETFKVLVPTPISQTLELLGPQPFRATLTEKPIPGDETSSHTKDELPAYLLYEGDGDVTAPLVYVNYGTQEDYRQLQRMGVSVKGKIVIARYGNNWRGLKPKLAQEHGAVGCIIYSDPDEDGYGVADIYPKGPGRPPNGIQRGSVGDMMEYPGDPLTPGLGATDGAPRLAISQSPVVMKIPAVAISYGDAQHFLAALHGRVVPYSWRGALPITYHIGGGRGSPIHLAVKSDWALRNIYDVVASIRGSEYPDQWIMRGNHHDGWVFGAGDPLSGHISMMGEAKAIGELLKTGWRPKRTLVYLSWDAEEAMLLGSTEWAETHADELKKKALVYVNSDGNGRGFLGVDGSPPLQHLINRIAGEVVDPETGVTVGARWRARMRVSGLGSNASEEGREKAKIAADPSRDLPIGALGSGSDFTPFLEHLGIASIDVAFGDEAEDEGVYHSAYDTYEYYTRFSDPGFLYAPVLAKFAGRLVISMADSEIPQRHYSDFADVVARYVTEVKALADAKREEAEAQSKVLSDDLFRLTDDPALRSGKPTPLKPVPYFDFAPLDNAVNHLKRSATAYDRILKEKGAEFSMPLKAELFDLARKAELSLTADVGLPGRSWYKNLIYAPGHYTGYSVKTLPGVREAIEEERWSDVDRYALLTAAALDAYAGVLDKGVQLMSGAGLVAKVGPAQNKN